MNHIKLSIVGSVLAVGLLLTGCDNKLDINPINSVDAQQALQTAQDLDALLVGAYDALGNGNLYGGNLLRDAELLGDNGETTWNGTFLEPAEIARKAILTTNGQVRDTWLAAYYTINICNTVLANLNLAEASERGRIEGEAKFIRGTMYFELVRFYARPWGDGDANTSPGVPLVLTPTTVLNQSNQVPRNSVAEVYAQVIKDLTEAETRLPATNGFFSTKGAAAGMLARVYLQQGSFGPAASAADRVIASNRYQLVPIEEVFDLRLFINGFNTDETVFAVQVTDQDGVNNLNLYYAIRDYGGRGDIYIQERHLNLYEQADQRGGLFYEDDGGLLRTAKFVNQYGNVQVLRLAEMYLIRAEANFRNNTSVGAAPLDDVNLIRARAGLAPLTPAQLTLNAILRERRLELAFEGTLIHDIKRTRQNIGTIRFNDPRLIYPIPQREIDANRALVQNAGY
ncbi:RagB/SusD domain protein [Fibrisoma limi BUZ 3]|uniref:RagB/SusD domain protein n=1 Tax=Fibrisoma limi BUZ 3 TaxID=1185876 RepID=I2GCN5_9BACT|nr:RagB/SusD family nutrient uptake outer membrane protein [Fibrisoma limi]CCH51659.1 RagB/SusD domain protein [Fibrisoma limi BUZ 3]